MEANNNNNAPEQRDPLVNLRDRLFHTMFFRLSLAYARSCPRQLQRMLECFILLMAVLSLMMLVYIHLVYTRHPVQCLEHIKDSWPRDGILRVEVVKAAPPGYNIDHSYEKEKKLALRHRKYPKYLSPMFGAHASKIKTVFVNMTDQLDPKKVLSQSELATLSAEVSELEKITKVDWPEDAYIVEYSLEIGFLRLSRAVRSRLDIPVHIEVLDPAVNQCFGDSFSRFIRDNFLGYDDVLLSSIKSLAEKEDNKGYLRNVVTHAQYHFVSRWSSSSSKIAAAIGLMFMMVFTISISMLQRYSQHQLFVLIIDWFQVFQVDYNTLPEVILLTVVTMGNLNTFFPVLVVMMPIMSVFFENTTACPIILMVWLCDQYDAICCHTPITKRYWLRFFYLYHMAFYAYHFRFFGQYSGLALLTTWLFTQHSMLYFFHHYELPVILQQAQLREILMNNNNPPQQVNFGNGGVNNVPAAPLNNTPRGRAAVRPRMRGFTLGGFRFRFGIVLQTINHPHAHNHNQEAPAAGQDAAAATLQRQQEQQPPPPPQPEPAEEAVETPDPAVLRRYVAEVQASAMAVEQLEAEGRLSPPPTQPLLEDTEEEDWGSDEPTPREEQPRAEGPQVGEQGTCSEKEKRSNIEDSSETKVNSADDSNPSVHSNTVTGDNLNAGPTATVGDLSGACVDINHLTEAVARGAAEHSAKEPAGKDSGGATAAVDDDQLVVIRQTELDEMRTNLRQASETLKSLRDSQ